MKKTETIIMLADNEKNRRKTSCMSKIEVMADDGDNGSQKFWDELEGFLEWGKTYKFTIEEV